MKTKDTAVGAAKVTRAKKGASRVTETSKSHAAPRLLRKLLSVCVLASVFGGIATALVWFDPQAKIEQLTHRPIDAIQIEGSFRYLSKDQTEQVVEQLVSGSFLDLNIEQLKNELEQNPWVDSVSVARAWPDKLIVRVVEQQPIARWGRQAFLNMRGDIITVDDTGALDALPLLQGSDDHAREVMQQYLSMGKLLSQSKLDLRAVELDQTLAWTLTLDSGVTLKLGRDRLWEKLQYLLAAKNGVLGENFAKVQSVDMRYPGGFAVAWKSLSEEQYVAGVQ